MKSKPPASLLLSAVITAKHSGWIRRIPVILLNWYAEYKRLLSLGAQMLNEPTTHPWGARSFQIKDPDGNILNFRTITKGERP